MILKKHLSEIILIINCLLFNIVTIKCSTQNVIDNRDSKLDPSTDISKHIMHLAKSADIQAMLSTKVDPCDDFYKYACGRWHRHNPAQLLTNLITDRFQAIAQAYERRLENFLENLSNTTSDEITKKVRGFYVSCQLIGADHISYVLHLENIYKEYSNLPVLAGDNWQEEADFNWWHTIANIQQKYGKQIIFAVDIMSNLKNNTTNSIYVGRPVYAIAGESKFMQPLDEPRVVDDLKRYFGVEHETAVKVAHEMIEFELALKPSGNNAKVNMKLEDMLIRKNLNEFDKIDLHGFNVRKFLELAIGSAQQLPEVIYIYDEEYFNNTLNLVSSTPKRTVANYILWQLLQEYMIDEQDKEVSKKCQELTKKYWSKYLDYALYQTYKTEEQELDVEDVWQELRETFRDTLQGDKLDWISNSTRSYAIQKLDAMRLHINSYEDINFTEIYANLSINRLGYVENVRHLLIIQNKDRMKKFSELSVKLSETTGSPVDGFTTSYNAFDNSISIPVALLQPRFFWDKNYPQAIKYATLGYLIAHEMVHGFDDEGRHYDMNGNQYSWWDEKSTYEFEARRKCFRAQYQGFKAEGRHMPKSISQSENIADNAAIRLAYKTYMRWVNKQLTLDANIEQKETLPGLSFDNRQLFFVSFAQLWCVDVQVLFKFSLAAADTHAPSMYRVIGSLSNFQEFSWVFKCNPEAKMDPKYKCYLY